LNDAPSAQANSAPKRKKRSTLQKIEKTVERQLGLENKSEYDLFALVPLRSDNKAD